jgi:hypothetical protein
MEMLALQPASWRIPGPTSMLAKVRTPAKARADANPTKMIARDKIPAKAKAVARRMEAKKCDQSLSAYFAGLGFSNPGPEMKPGGEDACESI